MKKFLKYSAKFLVASVLIFIGLFSVALLSTHIFMEPTNDRDWNDDQRVLPTAEIRNNLVSIYNIRNFSYSSTTDYNSAYYSKTFDLNKLRRVWYVVEPFSGIPGSAHTFVSFEFEDGQFVSISVEIRKEKGEDYHPIKGLFNQYELMYVIADERDVIKLRSNYRKDQVYVYPIRTNTEKAREMFLDMVKRANQLAQEPEFYNTITNTCTTNIVRHVNKITPNKVPLLNLRILLPANSDKLAYELGLIDTTLSFEKARKRYFINERAMKYANSKNFSLEIRNIIPD